MTVLPESSPPCCVGYCTDRQSCSASCVLPAPLSPDSSVTPPTGSPPLSSSSSTGQPTLSLRPDSSLRHSPRWSRMAACTQTHGLIHTVTWLSDVQSDDIITGVTWDWRVLSAGGGSGGEQLLDVRQGQTCESLQLQTRNTQQLSDRLQLSWRFKTTATIRIRIKTNEDFRCPDQHQRGADNWHFTFNNKLQTLPLIWGSINQTPFKICPF